MSKFTNYDHVSLSYDGGRSAPAADVMAGLMHVHLQKRLKDIHVLDAGCGTGNYTKALLEFGVGKITMFDASEGMLKKARVKLAEYIDSGRIVEIRQHKLPSIPFSDDSFDVVMFNQVMHHLQPNTNVRNFDNVMATYREARRALKPEGILLMTNSLQEQVKDSIWFYKIIPENYERYAMTYPSTHDFRELLDKSGFHCQMITAVLGSDWFAGYHDVEGPLDKAWRDSVSYWASATDKEIEGAVKFIQDLKDRGELQAWKEARDKSHSMGGVGLIFAKPKLLE